jgi:molecular chaperone GrpE (heat shock protein)
VQARLEKRVEKLTTQLDEMRDIIKREVAEDMENARKYADSELAIQKRRLKKVAKKIKKENREMRSWIGQYIEEHEVLKDVTKGVADTAKSLEERVRKILSTD